MKNQNSIQAFNQTFTKESISECYDTVKPLVDEYMTDKNCWPALWISDKEFSHLSKTEKAAFVHYAINHPDYNRPAS